MQSKSHRPPMSAITDEKIKSQVGIVMADESNTERVAMNKGGA